MSNKESHPSQDVNVSALLAGSVLEPGHQVSGHPAAVFDLDAVPGPHSRTQGRVQARRRPAAAARTTEPQPGG